MGLFLSTWVNKIDRKGRVSVPGPFRAALGVQPYAGIVLMRSPTHMALEGFAPSAMEDIADRLDGFSLFSADQDDLAAATLAQACPLMFDSEGRVVLPADLVRYAGLEGEAVFVGLGRKFQVWAPDAWKERAANAQEAMKSKGLSLPTHSGGAGHG